MTDFPAMLGPSTSEMMDGMVVSVGTIHMYVYIYIYMLAQFRPMGPSSQIEKVENTRKYVQRPTIGCVAMEGDGF